MVPSFASRADWNIGLKPVRQAGLKPAVPALAECNSAGHTDLEVYVLLIPRFLLQAVRALCILERQHVVVAAG